MLGNMFAGTGSAYYVAKTGNDTTGDGSLGNPWLTIGHALGEFSGGETLFIRAGTYAEGIANTIPSGTAGANTVLKAYPGEAVTIQPASGTAIIDISTAGKHHVTIDGIILDAVNTTYGAYFYDSAANVTVQNCEVKNASNDGMRLFTTDITCRNLDIHSNGAYGIRANNIDILITQCEVYSNTLSGLGLTSGVCAIVNRCDVHDNGESGILGGGCVVKNNIIYDNTERGIYIADSGDAEIYNNTCVGNDEGIRIHTDATDTIVTNNICYDNASGNYVDNGVDTVSTTNITDGTDPDFVDEVGRDFHIETTSAAKNAGTNVGAVRRDYDSVARPAGAYDIGAFEYVA